MATKNRAYLVDCTANPVTMTLPPDMAVGDWNDVEDAAESFGTHTFTIAPAESGLALKINGGTDDYTDTAVSDKLSIRGVSTARGVSIK